MTIGMAKLYRGMSLLTGGTRLKDRIQFAFGAELVDSHRRSTRRPRSIAARRRYCDTDLAEYLIPVNADIEDVRVIMLPEEDDAVNELGIKGIGELADVGTKAAVANVWRRCQVRERTSVEPFRAAACASSGPSLPPSAAATERARHDGAGQTRCFAADSMGTHE